MERKLGEIQQINGKWYQLVKADKNNSCNGCSFFLSDNGRIVLYDAGIMA